MTFTIGLDLGQAADYTAVSVLETTSEPSSRVVSHAVRHLDRWRGVPYPEIVERVALVASKLPAGAALVVDATGVGAAVVDLFQRGRLRASVTPVSIHGGEKVTREGTAYRVPKRDLVGTVAVLLEAGRLKVASALPHAAALVNELRSFRVTIDPRTAHDSYAAWREKDHDDLVLSVALAGWWAERYGRPLRREDVAFGTPSERSRMAGL